MSDTQKEEHTVAATLADPQYKAGRKLIDDGRLEEAVDFFSGLLETRVALLSGNEMCPALAPLYYEYGNSLLYNAEESGAVFGDAITEVEKKKAMAIVDAQLQGAMQLEENGGGGAEDGRGAAGAVPEEGDGDGAAAPTPDQEAEEDLEIAWENLEMARRIYSELELTEEVRVPFAKVHLRLGDLNMVNGMYNEAAEEFEKCLEHRLAMPNPVSRGVADAHVRRAQALFYASTLEGADKDALVASSLQQYRLAAGIFEAMLKSMSAPPPPPSAAPTPTPIATPCASPGKENDGDDSAESTSETFKGKGKGKGKGAEASSEEQPPAAAAAAPLASGSAEELQDVLDAIRETIDTMVSGKDMEALAEYKSGAVSTTVGFGDASSTGGGGVSGGGAGAGAASEKGVAGEVTTIGFGAPATAGVGGEGALPGFGSSGSGGGFGGASTAFGGGAVAPAANVMVVKRKGRPTPKVAPIKVATVKANGVGGGQEGEGGDTAKKAKSNS